MLVELGTGDGLTASFVNREQERRWLLGRLSRRGPPIVITGVGGIGKTTLIRHVLASMTSREPPLVWNFGSASGDPVAKITEDLQELHRTRRYPPIAVLDEAESLTLADLNDILRRLRNWKSVERVVVLSRTQPNLPDAEILELQELTRADSEAMLRLMLGAGAPGELLQLAGQLNGHPLTLSLLAGLARDRDPRELAALLRREIYSLDQRIIISERRLIAEIKPRLISTNDMLVERLRERPEAVYDLPPRKFEELIADLLADLGYEVELTPQSRDGGKDILAYMNTPAGRLLCLVEAKKYRRDRQVGVELVRQLYGTLVDADASSAMLVTTSAFSSGARDFEQRHRYRLSLRDYPDLVEWIDGYGSGTASTKLSKRFTAKPAHPSGSGKALERVPDEWHEKDSGERRS